MAYSVVYLPEQVVLSYLPLPMPCASQPLLPSLQIDYSQQHAQPKPLTHWQKLKLINKEKQKVKREAQELLEKRKANKSHNEIKETLSQKTIQSKLYQQGTNNVMVVAGRQKRRQWQEAARP